MEKSHIKELFSQTAIYGVGILLNKSVTFLLLPVYTFYFLPKELGLFNLVQAFWLFIILIYVYGLETSFIKFFIDAKEEKLKSEIYSTTLILISVTSLIFSLIIYFTSASISNLIGFEDIPKGTYLIKILSGLLFFDTLSRFPLLLLRAELNAKKYFYLTTFTLIINICLNLLFIIVFKLNVEAILFSYIISVLFILIPGLFITKKYLTFNFSFSKAKELVLYGNKFIYFGLFLLLIDISDRFFLKYFFDESVVGIYSASYRLASVMSLSIAAFKFSWTPYFLNLSDNPENKKIISDIFTYFVFTGLLLFLVFAFLTGPVVNISFGGYKLLDTKYQSGLIIIPVILLSYFFSGLFSNLNVVPFYKNKTGILLLTALEGIIINVILNFILIPKFSMIGAAYSTLITYAIMFLHIYIISQKNYKINYEWKRISIIVLLTILIYFIDLIIKKSFLIQNIYLMAFSTFLIIMYLLILNIFKIIEISRLKTLIKKDI